jgi:hypothetical protein
MPVPQLRLLTYMAAWHDRVYTLCITLPASRMQATLADDIDSSMQAAALLPTCTAQAELLGDSDRHDSKKTT